MATNKTVVDKTPGKTSEKTAFKKSYLKKYSKKGVAEIGEIYVITLGEREAEPVEVDGKKFMIFLIEDKEHVEVDRSDILELDGVRMDSMEGNIRIYPKMGHKKLCYDFETHRVWTKTA